MLRKIFSKIERVTVKLFNKILLNSLLFQVSSHFENSVLPFVYQFVSPQPLEKKKKTVYNVWFFFLWFINPLVDYLKLKHILGCKNNSFLANEYCANNFL